MKPIHKFNNGNKATLCTQCKTIIEESFTSRLFCDKCKHVTIYLPKGLPASGKSTWAKEFVKENYRTVIISRDSIREMLHGGYKYVPHLENLITDVLYETATYLLLIEYSIILDATNLNKDRTDSFVYVGLVEDMYSFVPPLRVDVIEKDFTDVPVAECIRRDKERDRSVGEEVIRSFYKNYILPTK